MMSLSNHASCGHTLDRLRANGSYVSDHLKENTIDNFILVNCQKNAASEKAKALASNGTD